MTTFEEAKAAWDELMQSKDAPEIVEWMFNGEEWVAPILLPTSLSAVRGPEPSWDTPVIDRIVFRMERYTVGDGKYEHVYGGRPRRAYRIVTSDGHVVAEHIIRGDGAKARRAE